MQDNMFLQATKNTLMCKKPTSKNKESHKDTSKSQLWKVYLIFLKQSK